MSAEPTLDVSFEIHGAVCYHCTAVMATTREASLIRFRDEHAAHNDIGWICKVTAPPQMASDRLVELTFRTDGSLEAK